MRYILTLFLIFSSTLSLQAIDIDENSSKLSILDKASIFIDKTNRLNQEEVFKKQFSPTTSDIVSLGYTKDTALWIKFALTNKSSEHINKILEYAEAEAEELFIYNGTDTTVLGLLHLNNERTSLNPTIYLSFKAYETKTFYIKSYSKIKAIKAKLILWNQIDFMESEFKHQMYRFVFFGIMITLFIYNFMLFLFTKDKAYFYYVFYLISIISFNAFYSGIFSLYFPIQELTTVLLKGNVSFGVVIILFSLLFTQEFLETKNFEQLNKTLNMILFTLPLIAIASYDNWIINSEALHILLLFGLFIVYVGFYALFQGVKQARFYVLGWSIIFIAFALVGLQAVFHYDLEAYNLTYVPEVAFILEALLFSIALAHRINITNQKLIIFQSEEQKKLQKVVAEKTRALSVSGKEKEVLYKELNHRIKNNLMMILSLLQLQIRRTPNKETKASLKVAKNRIQSISSLYEILLLKNDSINADTLLYIQGICNHIAMGSPKKITIDYNIQYNLDTDSLIYIGLIVNELITNSFKYAFDDDHYENGKVTITIEKKESTIFVSIIDNGKGFKERKKNSLGLTIVEILVEGQLEGELKIDSTNGTKVFINWEDESL